MKNLSLFKLLAALVLLSLVPMSGSATVAYPFLTSVRTEVTNQLNIVTNTVPLDTKRLAVLKAALKSIDRTTATNLTTDVQTLNVLVVGLGKSSLSNTFLPLLDNAADQYYDVIADGYESLTNRIVLALPSGTHTAADKNLALLLTTLQKAGSTNLFAAVKLIGQAASKLKTCTLLVTRAEAVLPGPNAFTAMIGSTAYSLRGELGPGHPSGVRADYTDATHILVITGSKLVGANAKLINITIGSVTNGVTVHTFGGGGSTAVASYSAVGLSGNGTSTSTDGTITVNMNEAKRVFSGSYSFNIAGTAGNSLVKGTFLLNY